MVDRMKELSYSERLGRLREGGLYRRMRVLASGAGVRVRVDGKEKTVFCSNNYLGLAGHQQVIAAVRAGLGAWGFGSGASRLVCGTMEVHEQLEGQLAARWGKERCLIFPTGFMANYAVLSTLPERGDLVILDKLVHASIIEGARASAATVRTFAHRQVEKLERLLARDGYGQAYIVTDSLFSMDGDRARLAELTALKRRFGAVLMVDEAHAFGCIGPKGKGCAADEGVLDDVDILVATFSKALGGAGGFLAGSAEMIELLVNQARGFIYTTGIPAVHCLAARGALDILDAEPQRRERLLANGDYFRQRCRHMGFDADLSESYIVPIILGSPEEATAASEQLWQRGLMIPAIRPPTVAPGSSRLRISLTSEHTREDIDGLCQMLEETLPPRRRTANERKGRTGVYN